MSDDNEVCGEEKADGSTCQSPIVGDVGRCPAHREGGDEEMRKRGRAGAEARKERLQGGGFDASELPPLTDMDAVRQWSERIGRACAEGRISEKRANSLSRLLRQARQAMEAEVGNRLEELREEVQRMRKEVEEPWK